MASSNKTSKLKLTQFLPSDSPSWLGDYNTDMRTIETEMEGMVRVRPAKATLTGNAMVIDPTVTLQDTEKADCILQFTASEDFNVARTYSVCGQAVTVYDIAGKKLEDGWKAGMPVQLYKKGAIAYFNGKPSGVRKTYFATTATWPADKAEGDILAVYV